MKAAISQHMTMLAALEMEQAGMIVACEMREVSMRLLRNVIGRQMRGELLLRIRMWRDATGTKANLAMKPVKRVRWKDLEEKKESTREELLENVFVNEELISEMKKEMNEMREDLEEAKEESHKEFKAHYDLEIQMEETQDDYLTKITRLNDDLSLAKAQVESIKAMAIILRGFYISHHNIMSESSFRIDKWHKRSQLEKLKAQQVHQAQAVNEMRQVMEEECMLNKKIGQEIAGQVQVTAMQMLKQSMARLAKGKLGLRVLVWHNSMQRSRIKAQS